MFPFCVLVCAPCSVTNDSMTQWGITLFIILPRKMIRDVQTVLHVPFLEFFGNYLVHTLRKTSRQRVISQVEPSHLHLTIFLSVTLQLLKSQYTPVHCSCRLLNGTRVLSVLRQYHVIRVILMRQFACTGFAMAERCHHTLLIPFDEFQHLRHLEPTRTQSLCASCLSTRGSWRGNVSNVSGA